jgi:outer membrane receptor protein involved in Fe transport
VIDAFTTVDARARFTPGYGIGIDAGVYNILDKNYQLSLGYPEAGRSVSVGVSYDFSGGGQ